MASLVANPLRALWGAYERQLERRPVLTQMATSAVLWGSGDLIAQRLEHRERVADSKRAAAAAAAASHAKAARGRKAAPPPPAPEAGGEEPQAVVDWRRAVMTGLFGATFVGPVGHFWYLAIDRWCAKLLPGGGPAFIGAKVLVDTVAMGPFYVAAFFAWGCALIDGSGLPEFKRKMRVDFVPTLAAEVSVWPLVQAVNFSVVPIKHQLLVVNTMTIFDAAFMSWARNSEDWLAKVLLRLGLDSHSSSKGSGAGAGEAAQPALRMQPLPARAKDARA